MTKLNLNFLPIDIRDIVINYAPEIYIYKCRRRNKRLRTEIDQSTNRRVIKFDKFKFALSKINYEINKDQDYVK